MEVQYHTQNSMKYYLITATEYNAISADINQLPSWSLDNTKCIVEVEDSYNILNNLQEFADADACDSWRWNETTEEWRNWATEDYWNGTNLDDF